jgi:hypothetical protein
VVTGTGAVSVAAAKATQLKLTAPAVATAGAPFDLTVIAADPFGNSDPNYTGTVHFASTDLKAGVVLPPNYTFTGADAGTHTFFGGFTLVTAGARTLSAAPVGSPLLTKGAAKVTVAAGALNRFLVTGLPTTVGVNTTRTFTIIAQDAYGNTITNYAGTVQFAVAGGTAVLPVPYTFTTLDKGKHAFTVKFTTPGPGQSLTVADGSITGTWTGITVV